MFKLTQLIRELGFVGTGCYLVNRVAERLFGKRLFYYYSIVAQPVVSKRMRGGKQYSVKVAECWAQIAEFLGDLDTRDVVIRERFAQRAKCILLFRDERLLACAWTALDGYFEDEVRCRFEPLPAAVTAWDFDVYVLPEHRGTLTFARLWDAVNAYYEQRNRKWTFSRISRFNVASINSHKSLGAITVASVLFTTTGKVQLLLSPARPYVHLSLSDKTVPCMQFDIGIISAASTRS